jgi:hypothetical protein
MEILAEWERLLWQVITPVSSVVHTRQKVAVAVGMQESAQIPNALETARLLTISQMVSLKGLVEVVYE